ncbi:hypothetical protein XELAEV_18045028mg, partial [Xenopus laevis]
ILKSLISYVSVYLYIGHGIIELNPYFFRCSRQLAGLDLWFWKITLTRFQKGGQTLRDKLCPAEPRKSNKSQSLFQGPPKKGTFPCLSCICCSSIIKGENVHHPISGKGLKLHTYATCESSNVVYLLKCPCGLVYIGQTFCPVKERIKEHRSNIRNFKAGTQTDTSISRHFSISKHNLSHLKWQVLDVICKPKRGGNILKLLLQEEANWIKNNYLHPITANE